MKIKKFNELNENWERDFIEVDPNEDKIKCHHSEIYCPYCGAEQGATHPRELLDDDGYGRYECENCEKEFEIEEMYYLICSKIK